MPARMTTHCWYMLHWANTKTYRKAIVRDFGRCRRDIPTNTMSTVPPYLREYYCRRLYASSTFYTIYLPIWTGNQNRSVPHREHKCQYSTVCHCTIFWHILFCQRWKHRFYTKTFLWYDWQNYSDYSHIL